ncbi:MAG TPA: hypothetical protein PLG51_08570, partial [Pseudomonadales bacterium]|nr:hypothetical protein [Pseudomonadales bacterium]
MTKRVADYGAAGRFRPETVLDAGPRAGRGWCVSLTLHAQAIMPMERAAITEAGGEMGGCLHRRHGLLAALATGLNCVAAWILVMIEPESIVCFAHLTTLCCLGLRVGQIVRNRGEGQIEVASAWMVGDQGDPQCLQSGQQTIGALPGPVSALLLQLGQFGFETVAVLARITELHLLESEGFIECGESSRVPGLCHTKVWGLLLWFCLMRSVCRGEPFCFDLLVVQLLLQNEIVGQLLFQRAGVAIDLFAQLVKRLLMRLAQSVDLLLMTLFDGLRVESGRADGVRVLCEGGGRKR